MMNESSFLKPPTLTPTIPYQILEDELIKNAGSTSRTVKTGTIDTSISKEKTGADKNTQEVKDQTRENIKTAARYIFDKKNTPFTSGDDIKTIVIDLNRILGIGFDPTTKQYGEWYNLRTHEISPEKGYGVPLIELKEKMNIFYKELFQKIQECEDGTMEPWRVAAWIEFQIDNVLHPYADRCGRMAKILAAYVLHRFNKYLPDYGSREEYYASLWSNKNASREKQYSAFEAYYRTAFEKGNP